MGKLRIPVHKELRYISRWKDGLWDEGQLVEDNQICVSAASDVFRHGQSCFEGLKPAGRKRGRSGFSGWTRTRKRSRTAAVITPIGVIEYRGRLHVFRGEAEVGPVTRKLCETLTGIQFGDVEAPGEWIFKVK